MNTQLVLYPQTFKGQFGSTLTPIQSNNESVINGVVFFNLAASNLHNTTAANPAQNAIDSLPATYAWQRFTTTGGSWGSVTAPTNTNQNLVLSYNATAGHTGVYQKLLGMSTNGQYDIIIKIATPATGTLSVKIFNGTNMTSSAAGSSNVTQFAHTFSSSISPTILIDYTSTTGNLTIESVSVQPNQANPPMTDTFSSGEVICDLYEEEAIPLTLSIDDFKNAAEQVKSYSKDFDLPATKRNNKIFDNIFEVTRADDGLVFNPYKQTQAVLKQDGFIIFEGYLRLINIKDQEGEMSYNVNLFSEVIAFADRLKDLTFANIDFSELEHTYDKAAIKGSFDTDGLPLTNPLPSGTFAGTAGASVTDVLKYPFIDWNHQFIRGGTNTSSNNALDGTPELLSLQQAFRPCIKIKYLIDRIFANSGFNYTSDFFDTSDFGKLFVDFNWGEGNAPAYFNNNGQGYIAADQTGTGTLQVIQTNDNNFSDNDINYSAGVYTASNNNQTFDIWFNYIYTITGSTGAWDIDFVWKHYDSSAGTTTNIYWDQVSGTAGIAMAQVSGQFQITIDQNDTLTPYFRNRTTAYTLTLHAFGSYFGSAGITNVLTWTIGRVDQQVLVASRGELGQWDFLKSIFKMFNLVTLVDENDPNNILIEPYKDVFIADDNGTSLASRGIQHDWTEKIDVESMELKPLDDLDKTTIFKFAEDADDYAAGVYKNSNYGRLLGSATFDASGYTILQGVKNIEVESFAATLVKPLMSQYANLIVPILYSLSDDGTTESFDNTPRIFYNNGKKSLGASPVSYYVPAQNGGSSENVEDYLQFSNLSTIPTTTTTKDFFFSSQNQVLALGQTVVDNLFNTYWLPYLSELYHPDTRVMTLKVNLNASDINTFKFTDKVFVKNRVFRVNKIDYKPNALSTVEFILIG